MANWKAVKNVSILIAFFFALEPSYIHPDEHFQSLEVLTHKIYGYAGTTPWEFQDPPSRSYAVLYLIYGPIMWLNKNGLVSGLPLMYLLRLQLAISYLLITKVTFSILCDTRRENTKAFFFLFTSYITWTYQSHTFSNSIETQLLLLVLSLIQLVRRSKVPTPSFQVSFLLGTLISIGVFNRITFIAFLVFPAFTLMSRYLRSVPSLAVLILSFLATSAALVFLDTAIFGLDEFVVAPYNNIIYNSSKENLAKHGLHPYYTHILVNIPQLIGPAIIPFFFRNHYKTTLPYLAIFSGLTFLSLIPHQELRFLIPLLPLICICIDLTNFEKPQTADLIMKLWCIFNVVFGVIMGSGHQRGVLEALNHLSREGYEGPQIWWKTYSPPTWILGYQELTVNSRVPDSYSPKNLVIDLMGADNRDVVEAIEKLGETLLITPRSSVPLLEHMNGTMVNFEKVWSYEWNLDLDHFDISDIRTFYPGIDIYKATSLI